MRGESGPAPIYEGDDSIVAWLLAGPEAAYEIDLAEPGAPRRAILETYTKAHSAEYMAQALIDLACRLRGRIEDVGEIGEVVIHTSDHTHRIIGNGANDPQKYDSKASRETLDHSAMYIFAVRWRTAPGTTSGATCRHARPAHCRCGVGSGPWRTRAGPGAITRPTPPNAPSAPAP